MINQKVGLVCDSGPLIHLDELESLYLLGDFDPVLVPKQVWQEVALHRPDALKNFEIRLEKVGVVVSSEPAFQTLARSLSLDLGEQAALSLMRIHPQSIFITDDAAARLAAVALGYSVHGSIGILIRAIRRRQKPLEEVIKILREIPVQSTLHIRTRLLQEIIAQLENRI